MPQIWAGVDIGKTHHHCVVLDAEGKRLLSRRVLNDEPELLALLAEVPTCLRETQPAVRTAPAPVPIVVVLPIVLPEAHGTDLVGSALIERQEAAAGTAVRAVLGVPLDVDEGADHHGSLTRCAADRDPIDANCPSREPSAWESPGLVPPSAG